MPEQLILLNRSDQREFKCILREIIIPVDLQILLINLNGRTVIDLDHAALIRFRNRKMVSQTLPSDGFIHIDMKLFSGIEDRKDLIICKTVFIENVMLSVIHGMPSGISTEDLNIFLAFT